MSTIEETIEVRVPVTTAYNQWTQFEDFPTFMEGVEEVRQIDDTHLHWRAQIAGKAKEWDAKITDQSPDRCVAWTATDGAGNGGVITFHPVSGDRTQVKAKMDVEPEGVAEKAGDVLGVAGGRCELLREAVGAARAGQDRPVDLGSAIEDRNDATLLTPARALRLDLAGVGCRPGRVRRIWVHGGGRNRKSDRRRKLLLFFFFAVATVADPMARQATRATTITRTFFERMSLPRKWTCPPVVRSGCENADKATIYRCAQAEAAVAGDHGA